MLVMTPEARRMMRRQRKRERDALRGRMGAGRFSALVKDLANVVCLSFEAGLTTSIFGLEGALRAGLRADLCLQGWGWNTADLMAADLMGEVFRSVHAERPSWNEGQREWTIEAGTLIERTRCVRCHKPLPDGHHKFCSHICASGHARDLSRLRQSSEDQALRLAISLT